MRDIFDLQFIQNKDNQYLERHLDNLDQIYNASFK